MDISDSGRTSHLAHPPEEALGTALGRISGIVVLHDRLIPGSSASIDHVVVGPAGIFVIGAKRYPGRIAIHNKGGLFRSERRLYVGRRDCSGLAEKIAWQAGAVGAALTAGGVVLPLPVVPVLCFIDGDRPGLNPPSRYVGVRLESERSIERLVLRERGLDSEAIERLARVLATALPMR